MTAHALVGDRDRCIEAGMDHYISKPIHKQDLARAIKKFFTADPDPKPVARDTKGLDAVKHPPPAKESSKQQQPTDPPFNLDAALEMMEQDRDILNSVVEAFVIEGPQLLKQLTRAVEAGDHVAAGRAAHTLKGNFRILQLQDHQALWAEVESIARDEKLAESPEAMDHACQLTRNAIRQLEQYLAAEQ
jgi:HPt (histidine-containing phosphotransfer) domain-containing protein